MFVGVCLEILISTLVAKPFILVAIGWNPQGHLGWRLIAPGVEILLAIPCYLAGYCFAHS
jgi:hypothetical protein